MVARAGRRDAGHPGGAVVGGGLGGQRRVRLARNIFDHRRADAGQHAEIAMSFVNLADAAHAERREELPLVQQPRQHRLQHRVIDDGQQMLAAIILPFRTRADIMAAEQAALARAQAIAEARRAAEQAAIDDFGREQRDEPDHRIDVDVAPGAVRRNDQILEETGLSIPQRRPVRRVAGKRLANGEELFIGLDGDVFVIRIILREFERNHRHVEGEHRHPAGRVGLLEAIA